MILAGLQKLSLVDYPEHLAAIVFTQGCNFKCGYCHNPDLIAAERSFDVNEDDLIEEISCKRDMLEGVVVTGGEPSIQPDLPEFLFKIKILGFKVKLDTNGSCPEMVERCMRKYLLDYLAVDIKTSLPKYGRLTRIPDIARKLTETIELVMLSTMPYEFRITCVPGLVERDDIVRISELIKGAGKCTLQQFRPVNTYDKAYSEIKPYPRKVLDEYVSILSDTVQKVTIRGF